MEACVKMGLPHSKFLNWNPQDRAKHLAKLVEDSSKCPGCGTAEWEWVENFRAYSPMEKICRGCEMKEFVSEGSESRPGKFVVLTPARNLR